MLGGERRGPDALVSLPPGGSEMVADQVGSDPEQPGLSVGVARVISLAVSKAVWKDSAAMSSPAEPARLEQNVSRSGQWRSNSSVNRLGSRTEVAMSSASVGRPGGSARTAWAGAARRACEVMGLIALYSYAATKKVRARRIVTPREQPARANADIGRALVISTGTVKKASYRSFRNWRSSTGPTPSP
jgi:hypothetical protein